MDIAAFEDPPDGEEVSLQETFHRLEVDVELPLTAASALVLLVLKVALMTVVLAFCVLLYCFVVVWLVLFWWQTCLLSFNSTLLRSALKEPGQPQETKAIKQSRKKSTVSDTAAKSQQALIEAEEAQTTDQKDIGKEIEKAQELGNVTRPSDPEPYPEDLKPELAIEDFKHESEHHVQHEDTAEEGASDADDDGLVRKTSFEKLHGEKYGAGGTVLNKARRVRMRSFEQPAISHVSGGQRKWEPAQYHQELQEFRQEPEQFYQEPQQFHQEPQDFHQEPQDFHQEPQDFQREPSQFYQELPQPRQEPRESHQEPQRFRQELKRPGEQKKQTKEQKKAQAQADWLATLGSGPQADSEEDVPQVSRQQRQVMEDVSSELTTRFVPSSAFSAEQLKEARDFMKSATGKPHASSRRPKPRYQAPQASIVNTRIARKAPPARVDSPTGSAPPHLRKVQDLDTRAVSPKDLATNLQENYPVGKATPNQPENTVPEASFGQDTLPGNEHRTEETEQLLEDDLPPIRSPLRKSLDALKSMNTYETRPTLGSGTQTVGNIVMAGTRPSKLGGQDHDLIDFNSMSIKPTPAKQQFSPQMEMKPETPMEEPGVSAPAAQMKENSVNMQSFGADQHNVLNPYAPGPFQTQWWARGPPTQMPPPTLSGYNMSPFVAPTKQASGQDSPMETYQFRPQIPGTKSDLTPPGLGAAQPERQAEFDALLEDEDLQNSPGASSGREAADDFLNPETDMEPESREPQAAAILKDSCVNQEDTSRSTSEPVIGEPAPLITPKVTARIKKKVAREALKRAWCDREYARVQVVSGSNLERAQELSEATTRYREKRNVLIDLMGNDCLNDDDKKLYPLFSSNDLAPPKHRPVGVAEVRAMKKKLDEEGYGDESEASDDGKALAHLEEPVEAGKVAAAALEPDEDGEVAALDNERGEPESQIDGTTLATMATAKALRLQALDYFKQPRPQTHIQYKDWKRRGDATLERANKFYTMKLNGLVEAAGGSLPARLRTEYPPLL